MPLSDWLGRILMSFRGPKALNDRPKGLRQPDSAILMNSTTSVCTGHYSCAALPTEATRRCRGTHKGCPYISSRDSLHLGGGHLDLVTAVASYIVNGADNSGLSGYDQRVILNIEATSHGRRRRARRIGTSDAVHFEIGVHDQALVGLPEPAVDIHADVVILDGSRSRRPWS